MTEQLSMVIQHKSSNTYQNLYHPALCVSEQPGEDWRALFFRLCCTVEKEQQGLLMASQG
jgi:formylglycine-generating enzyme required for sulfatase activity